MQRTLASKITAGGAVLVIVTLLGLLLSRSRRRQPTSW